MSSATIFLLVVFPAAMIWAAASDLFTMTISNRLCLAVVASFALFSVLAGLSPAQIGWHLAAGAFVLVIAFGLFAAGWIGGGDAKLAAAIALWFGFEQMLPYLLVVAVFGGALTVILLALRALPVPAFAKEWSWFQRLHAPTTGVPYGIALAFAALWWLPNTGVWHAGFAA